MKIFLFLLMLTSCLKKEIPKSEDLALRWLSATEVLNQNTDLLQGVVIARPEGTWQTLFTLKREFEGNKVSFDCVFFRVPSEQEKGVLKVKELPLGGKCDDFLLEKGDFTIKNIKTFSYRFESPTLRFLIDEKEHKFLFLKNPKKENSFTLFQGDHFNRKSEIRFQGAGLEDTKTLKRGEYCHLYANDCREEVEFQCDRCEKGIFTQVINSSCQRGYSKVCGDISCGNLNEPACIRGFKASGIKDHCVQDSPVGFCHDALRVRCVDGRLICSQ